MAKNLQQKQLLFGANNLPWPWKSYTSMNVAVMTFCMSVPDQRTSIKCLKWSLTLLPVCSCPSRHAWDMLTWRFGRPWNGCSSPHLSCHHEWQGARLYNASAGKPPISAVLSTVDHHEDCPHRLHPRLCLGSGNFYGWLSWQQFKWEATLQLRWTSKIVLNLKCDFVLLVKCTIFLAQ